MAFRHSPEELYIIRAGANANANSDSKYITLQHQALQSFSVFTVMPFAAKKFVVAAAIVQASLASALPVNEEPTTQCSNPRIRKEW